MCYINQHFISQMFIVAIHFLMNRENTRGRAPSHAEKWCLPGIINFKKNIRLIDDPQATHPLLLKLLIFYKLLFPMTKIKIFSIHKNANQIKEKAKNARAFIFGQRARYAWVPCVNIWEFVSSHLIEVGRKGGACRKSS